MCIRDSNHIDQLSNPTYDRDDHLPLQLLSPVPAPTPTYETITPLPTGGTKLELAELKEHDYDDVLNRGTPETKKTIHNDNAQRSNRKLGLMESSSPAHKLTHMEKGSQGCVSKTRVTSKSGDYPDGDLKENDHRCDNISTEFTPDAAVLPNKEERSGSQVQETSKSLQENKLTNTLLARNNSTGSDGTSSEHDYYELEDGETGQEETEKDLPRNKTTAREYEVVVPSSKGTKT